MKQINVWFEDDEHKRIVAIKEKTGLNWRKFILKLAKLDSKIMKGGINGK